MNETNNNTPKRPTVWQKIDYLTQAIDDLNIYYIRYCEFETSHLTVNDKQKWAYLVHDPGVVVSEISFEEVNYERAIKLFGKDL